MNTTNTNTVMIVIGTAIVVLLLVLVLGGGHAAHCPPPVPLRPAAQGAGCDGPAHGRIRSSPEPRNRSLYVFTGWAVVSPRFSQSCMPPRYQSSLCAG